MQKLFQGLLRRCAPRAIAAQWGEQTSENGGSFSSTISFGCGSSPESVTKENEECRCILLGTTSSLRSSCHCCAMGRTEGSYPTKAPRKRGMQMHYFRDYFAHSGLVPPSAGRTEGTGTMDTPCGVCALSGTTSPLRGSCRLRRGEPTSENHDSFCPAPSFGCGSSPESAIKENEECKCIPHFLGALSGTRTLGPLIKSQLLYQLS